MRSLERIKELIGEGTDIDIPSVKNVDKALDKTKKVIENAKKIRKVLNKLKKIGIKSIIRVNYENKKIRIYGRQFLLLVQEGHEVSINRDKREIEGSLEIDSVEIIGNLDRKLAKRIIKEEHQFEFHNSELKTKNLKEFQKALKKAPMDSIQHHYERGDIRRWLGRILGRGDLVNKIDNLNENLKDEELRNSLLEIIK